MHGDVPLEDLLDRIAGGDRRAMEVLFERERGALYGMFLRLSRCESLSSDLVQGTFLSLWRYRKSVGKKSSGAAYLYKVALNEWKRTASREARQREAVEARALETATVQETASPEDGLVEDERKRAVRDAIEALPDAQREVFVLHRFEGLSCREVAEILGESVKTVESRLRLALQKITKRLHARNADDRGKLT